MARLTPLLLFVCAVTLSACGKDPDKLVGPDNATQAHISRPAHIDQLPDTVDTLFASDLSLEDIHRACGRLPNLTSLDLSNCTGDLTEPLPKVVESLSLNNMEVSIASLRNLTQNVTDVSLISCTLVQTEPTSGDKPAPVRLSLIQCERSEALQLLDAFDLSEAKKITLRADGSFDDADLAKIGPFPSVESLDLSGKALKLSPGSMKANRLPRLLRLSIRDVNLDARAGEMLRELEDVTSLSFEKCSIPPQVFQDLKSAPALKNVKLQSCTGFSDEDLAFTRKDDSPWQLMVD